MSRVQAVRLAVVAAISVALLGIAAWGPLSARLTGTEVRLRVEAVDPIEPFRGAYVDLAYPDLPRQPQVAAPHVPEEPEQEPTEPEEPEEPAGPSGATVFIPLTRHGAVWVGGPVMRTRPARGLYLACDDRSWRLRCGIESWFLPQDKAAALGERLAAGTAVATVRVDARGRAALMAVQPR